MTLTQPGHIADNWSDWDYMVPVGYDEEKGTYGDIKKDWEEFIKKLLIFITLLGVMGLIGIYF